VDEVEQARRTMQAAADKAAGPTDQFAPFLRAAIAYWRVKEDAAQKAGDMTAHLEAVTQRITHEDSFRRVAGRSYHTVTDAISFDDVNAL